MIHVDVILGTSSVISFGSYSFQYTYSIHSLSNNSIVSSPLDATALYSYVMSSSEYIPYNLMKLMDSSRDMIISNGVFNTNDFTSFNISNNGNVKRMVIGKESYRNVRVIYLNGLSELESVMIGEGSFTYAKYYYDIRDSRRTDGYYGIVNCPKLQSIQIADLAFGYYHSFEISNLPSLQSIDVGKYCFYRALSFSLNGIYE